MIPALAAVLCLALQAEETVSSGNVVVRLPQGWKFERKEEGLFLRPGDLQESEALVVIIPPGAKADGNLAEGIEKSWKQVVGAKTVVKKAPARELKTEGGTDGLMTVGLMETADGVRLITTVAVFKPGDRYESVVAMTAQDVVFQRYSEALGMILKGLRFKNVELPTYELLLSMGYSETSGKTTVYALFRDGTWLATLPREGMDGLDAAACRKRFEASCGTHETKDGVITLRMGPRVETLKLGADGSYRTPENAQFLRIPPSTGLRLEGRFILHGREDKPESASLLFKADAALEDRGGTASAVPDEVGAKPGGVGRYEIADNTLWVKFADARIKRMSFLELPKANDPKGPEFILLGSSWFKRE
jgi:hypothetical protein